MVHLYPSDASFQNILAARPDTRPLPGAVLVALQDLKGSEVYAVLLYAFVSSHLQYIVCACQLQTSFAPCQQPFGIFTNDCNASRLVYVDL